MRRLAPAIAALALLLGLGAVASPAVAGGGADVWVGNGDAGSTVRVGLGQRLGVWLASPTSTGDVWSDPMAPDLLFRESLDVRADGAFAVFEAVRLGSTTVSASTDASCFHTEPACARPSEGWSVTVQVVTDAQTDEPSPVPSRPADSQAPPAVVVTHEDAGRTVDVSVGQTVGLQLGDPGAGTRWAHLSSPEQVGLFRTRVASDAAGASALFRAVGVGEASIVWSVVTRCVRSGECAQTQVLYSVRVRIGMAPGPPPPDCQMVELGPLHVSHSRITAGNRPTLTLRFVYRPGGSCQAPMPGVAASTWGGYTDAQVTWSRRSSTTLRGGLVAVEDVYTSRPSVQTSYVSRAGGLSSNSVLVRVHRRVELESAAVTAGRAGFRGTVTPVLGGDAVGVAAIVGGRWTYLGRTTMDSAGRFAASAPAVHGRATYVVYAPGGAGTLTGSASRQLP